MTLAILCPGQSCQSADMAERLNGLPETRSIFDTFEEVMGAPLIDIVRSGDLHANATAQPVICAIELASYALISDEISRPACIAGYSIGELAAYGCAGALSPYEVIRLAKIRAELMDAANPTRSGMIAVRGLLEAELLEICGDTDTYIAICNGADRFIAAGAADQLDALKKNADSRGASVTSLPVRVASHTPLMQAAVEPFRLALMQADFLDPSVPVIAGIDGAAVRTREAAIETLAAQLSTRIDWSACMESIGELGCRATLELMPGDNLTSMIKDRLPGVMSRSMAQFRSRDGILSWISRLGV